MDTQQRIFCDTEFWDVDIFWNTETPRITPCFRQSVLALVPCCFLWIVWSFKLCARCTQKLEKIQKPKNPCTLLYIQKLVLSMVLITSTLVELTYLVYLTNFQFQFVPLVDFYSVTIRMLTFMLALTLQILQRHNGQLNSVPLFIFWFISIMCGFFTSTSFDLIFDNLTEKTDSILFILTAVTYPAILGQMIISSFNDPDYSSICKSGRDDYVIEHQSIPSRFFFNWIDKLVRFGYRNTIKVDDLDLMSPEFRSEHVFEKMEKKWTEQKEICQHSVLSEEETLVKEAVKSTGSKDRSRPSLLWALTKLLWPWLLIAASLELSFDFVRILPPLILDLLISFIGNDEPSWHGYIYALLLFITAATPTMLMTHNMFFLVNAGIMTRVGLTAAVYRKSLKLSGAAKRQYTVGEMCNLIAVDVQKLHELIWSVNLVWSSPLRILLIVILLWQYLGVACLAGIAVMLVIMPITGILATKSHHLQASQMERKDFRLRQMSEILNGIKVLKLFAWEPPFMKRIEEIREKEVLTIKFLAFLNAGVVFLWYTAPFLVTISSFVTFVLMDDKNVLDPSIAFVSLTLFNDLRFSLSAVPAVITEIIQSRISFRRLESFLLAEELNEEMIGNQVPKGHAIVMDDASFSWSKGEEPFLRDITLAVPEGSLVALVGKVGAGKSALLSAALGEMYKLGGDVDVMQGNIAYVAQQAWIQNATLRDNILFLKTMEPAKYKKVLDNCCLKDDLKILPGGDQTEIGEKGINLSGGQKQRVSLARAVYQDAQIYLLDDPLAAVDSHVGAHIFNHVIGPNGALKDKTRILITHDLSVLPEVDVIAVMVNGRIEEMGSYRNLMAKKGEFSRFVEEHLKNMKDEEDDLWVDTSSSKKQEKDLESPTIPLSTEELKAQMMRLGSRLSRTISLQDSLTMKSKQKKAMLVDAEKMESGRVKASVFLTYFRYATLTLTTLMIVSFSSYQGFEVGSNVWLSQWSSDAPLPDGSQDVSKRNMRIGVYGLFGIGQGLCILAGAFIMAIASTKASVQFHRKMLMSILRSPMVFFETTPIGRILNRFGKDINVVDSNIPTALDKLLTCIVGAIGTIAVIAVGNPIIIAVMLPLTIVYVLIQNYYLATSRQVRRLQSVTLSPVMSNMSETVQGAATLRAFRAQQAFIRKEDQLVDDNIRSFFQTTLLNRWLAVRLELMGSLIVLIVAVLSVAKRNDFSAAMAGLTLSYTLNLTEILATLVKFYTVLEIRMVSVERIAEYSVLPEEAPWESCGNEILPKHWPQDGAVSFANYKLRYRKDMDFVLNGISVHIAPREKVGIVGRTGAGKSSLALALFRIVEPAEGAILIDGVDIATMGLHDLRSRLTIIPQDPVLFSGSLRLNLDPLGENSDDDLWLALSHAHLKSFVSSLGKGLNFDVAEGGDNLSVGQRQQICLARALLKRTKILVLDEATAAVDMETDRLIQSTIRNQFDQSTVITIAHRLYTILDYDRVIVMDNGKIIEEGNPDTLLQRPDSMFYKLGKDAGLL